MDSETQRGGNSDIVLYRSVSNTKYNDVHLFNYEQKVIYTITLISNVKNYNINTFGNRLIILNRARTSMYYHSYTDSAHKRGGELLYPGSCRRGEIPPPQLKKVAEYHDIVGVQFLVKTLF